MASRGILWVLVAGMLLAACTTEGGGTTDAASPSPTPAATAPPITGPRVAVVLRPPEEAPGLASQSETQAVERVRGTYADQLSEVRSVVPDEGGFVGDVIALMAERGYALVCVAGHDLVAVVTAIAVEYPRTRFCLFPAVVADVDVPPNVLLIDLAVEEPAMVAANVALRLAPQDPPAFVAARTEFAMERRRAAFQAAVRAQEPDEQATATPLVGVPADDAERAESFARTHFEAGATVLYTESGAADTAILPVAAEADGAVIGSVDTLFEGPDGALLEAPPAAVLFGIEERLDAALRVAIDRLLGGWSPEPMSVGFAEGAYGVLAGGHPRADEAVRLVDEILEELASGTLDPGAGP